ncbi:sodium:solute symporter family protein [Fodinibius sediminis]|uniref:Na+/proline symporter n=1 Tax=Fodinibius sediminis TaxID=1214077 RepID=A0A521C3S0_9BACT|nr:sodium:solute symporter family protein [Fodinibius sediminis]SMO53985.1 Na+/proline symporter [Fodinibius sediminis]
MELAPIDWTIIGAYMLFSLLIGFAVARKAGKNSDQYFAAGKNMPWWLLGISMVATTFSTDTPNLVANIVRTDGVSGNWVWWAFLLTGMLTVFVYAHLWKRSGVLTDVEFYELRYSGKMAAFLRGFRAVYLGFVFNVVIMATVSLAAIKIAGVLMGLSPVETVVITGVVTVIYSSLGGLRGVLLTDFFQFFLAIGGSLIAAYVALNHPQVGGFEGLLSHAEVVGQLNILPDFTDPAQALGVFIIPLAVQWWSVYYPGAEPGGGGYIAQRMFAAKDENNSIAAVFFFNAAHYALRPWPWIIVGLCSIIVFPDVAAMQEAFPDAASVADDDMGYAAMLTFIPTGWLGLVVASLTAAYMSTISTHLNWGSSYLVNDFYKRFINPESSEKELVMVGRLSTVVLMIVAGGLALLMQNALDSFQILLQIGAGTGLLFILRWFWWRINAGSEIAAMVISFVVAVYFQFFHSYTGLPQLSGWEEIVIGVILTTIGWVSVTYMVRPTSQKTLLNFYEIARPGGPGWQKVLDVAEKAGREVQVYKDEAWRVPQGIFCMLLGCFAVYGTLFATGYWIYGQWILAGTFTVVALVSSVMLFKAWRKLINIGPSEQELYK